MIYINGSGCVSAQRTFDGSFLEEVIPGEGTVLPVVAPPYKDFISPGMIRRMGSGVKNGVVASALALREAGSPEPDAILTGTGVGCIRDSENFLQSILDNGEMYLTPTAFIQSTHNTVGAQIALGLGCKAYNFSYVNGAVSFESALVDARLQLLSGEAGTVLVGGVDEKADYIYGLFALAGLICSGEGSPGATYSEGAAFFVLGTEKKEESYAVLRDVSIHNCLDPEEVGSALRQFLERSGTAPAGIDAVVIGKNDDFLFQEYYPPLLSEFSPEIPVIQYKHLCGEYNTASAFGFWLAAGILRKQEVPEAVLRSGRKPGATPLKHILLYNQYRGLDHSFVLLSAC